MGVYECCCLWGPELGVRSPRLEVSAINYLSQCWELNSGHLQEQYTILTAEPSPWALVQAILKCGFWGLNSGPQVLVYIQEVHQQNYLPSLKSHFLDFTFSHLSGNHRKWSRILIVHSLSSSTMWCHSQHYNKIHKKINWQREVSFGSFTAGPIIWACGKATHQGVSAGQSKASSSISKEKVERDWP